LIIASARTNPALSALLFATLKGLSTTLLSFRRAIGHIANMRLAKTVREMTSRDATAHTAPYTIDSKDFLICNNASSSISLINWKDFKCAKPYENPK
jgi:hypothetical protein